MRNREAARYARWAGLAALVVALIAAGTYIERSVRQGRARRAEAAVIPPAVEQQSSRFSLRSGEKGRTIFEIQASHATRFKGTQRAVLEDVVIAIHGRDLRRDDRIETQQCSYDPPSGAVRCEGPVRISLRPAMATTPAKGAKGGYGIKGTRGARAVAASAKPLEIETSNLYFDAKTGDASTPSAVAFSFPQGKGRGTGVNYSAATATLRVEHGVTFDVAPSPRTGGLPIGASGSALEMRRDNRTIELDGPAVVRQGGRELTAGKITVELDSDFHARGVRAEGSPRIRMDERGKSLTVSAGAFEGRLSAEGWIQGITAEGEVAGTRRSAGTTERLSASRLEIAMEPRGNIAEALTARGSVVAASSGPTGSRTLRTEGLRIGFAAPTEAPGEASRETPNGRTQAAEQAASGIESSQQIETAETLAPASIDASSARNENTHIRADKFAARFGASGRMERLLGHGNVEVRRENGNHPAQTSTAPELAATFARDGQLASLEESGGVRLEQGDSVATGARLTFKEAPGAEAAGSGSWEASGTATLEGAPVLSDAESRTTVGDRVTIQMAGEKAEQIRATGGVISTFQPTVQSTVGAGASVKLGSGAAHVFADTLSGSPASGHAIYEGHARLWQGDAVLDAERIEIWRDEKKMQAMGGVAAVFPQTPGPLNGLPGPRASKGAARAAGPAVWQVRAPSMTYWGEQGRIHLEGGVTAKSQENSMEAQTLDVFLTPAGATKAKSGPGAASPGAEQLSRIVADGAVIVRQGERRGTAARGEYTASDGKFVLSGGQPTLADGGGNTVTGRSLTFFLTDDTILIDSKEGSRTLTKHRVEK